MTPLYETHRQRINKDEPDREIRLVSISVNSVFIRRAAGLLLTAA